MGEGWGVSSSLFAWLTAPDQEAENRGLSFCGYADDCNVYVKTQARGERVMAGLTQFLEKWLKLKVITTKRAVAKCGRSITECRMGLINF